MGGRRVPDAVDEHAPAVLLLLAPAVGPPQDYRVGLHATEAGRLDSEGMNEYWIWESRFDWGIKNHQSL